MHNKQNENTYIISNNIIHQYGIYRCALILSYIIIHLTIKKLMLYCMRETNRDIIKTQRKKG